MIQAANAFNCPLRLAELEPLPNEAHGLPGGLEVNMSLFEVNTPQVLVQTVKMVS